MPAEPPKRAPFAMRMTHAPRIMYSMVVAQQQTRLSLGEFKKLHSDPKQVVKSEDGRQWCTLERWLNPDLPPTGEIVCLKTGLTLRLNAESLPNGVSLLPFEGALAATLETNVDGNGRSLELQAQLDQREKFLKLTLPFSQDVAGRQLYEHVQLALTRAPGVTVKLTYAHTFEAEQKKKKNVQFNPALLMTPATLSRGVFSAVDRSLRARPGTPAQPKPKPKPKPKPTTKLNPAFATGLSQRLLVNRGALLKAIQRKPPARPPTRQPAPRPQQPQQKQYAAARIAGTFSSEPIQRSIRDEKVFWDAVRPDQDHGWGQLTHGGSTLRFRPSDREDTFYYLPSEFKLGYYVDHEGNTVTAPVQITQTRTEEGDQRFRVTLVAIPHTDHEHLRALREHIVGNVMSGLLPFVRLEPFGGLQAEMVGDFLAPQGGEAIALPSGIISRLVDVDLDDRLVVEFEMAAERYAIFSELLLKGLHASVRVTSAGGDEALPDSFFSERIPVRLNLDEIRIRPAELKGTLASDAHPGVFLRSTAADATFEESGESTAEAIVVETGEEARIGIAMENTLAFPVRISSVTAHLLHLGELPGNIWGAESRELLPGDIVLGALGDELQPRHAQWEVGQGSLPAWEETVIEIGDLRVEGLSAQDWLHRVHQDPSLNDAEFRLRLASIGDREGVELFRLRIFAEGSSTVRQEREIRPTDDPVDWVLTMTLAELSSAEQRPTHFVLEYESIYANQESSLPQRMPVLLSGEEMFLRPLEAASQALYTVIARRADAGEEERADLSETEAGAWIAELRGEGAQWSVTSSPVAEPAEPAAPATPEDPVVSPEPTVDPPVTPEPAQPGVEVTLISDLILPEFESQALQRVFLTLQIEGDPDAPKETLTLTPENPSPGSWVTPPGTTPPFRFKVVYQFADGVRRSEGVERSSTLLLDPTDAA